VVVASGTAEKEREIDGVRGELCHGRVRGIKGNKMRTKRVIDFKGYYTKSRKESGKDDLTS